MTQDLRRGAKRFKKGWFVFGFLCLGTVLFHKPLLLLSCKAVLSWVASQEDGRVLTYEKMQWENDAIAISALKLKTSGSELHVDRIELKLTGELSKLRFLPQIHVIHPQIFFSATEESSTPVLPFLYRTRWIQPRWTIKNGVLHLPSSSRFYFSLSPRDFYDSIGSLYFSCDPHPEELPVCSADLAIIDKNLQIAFKLEERDLSRLLPLTALIASEVHRDWDQVSGELKLNGMVTFDSSFCIQQLHFQGAANKIALLGPKMGIDIVCDEMLASLSYPIVGGQGFFWNKINASLSVINGSCNLNSPLLDQSIAVSHLEGQFCFEPNTELQLGASGILDQDHHQIAFSLSGKGGIKNDSSLWSEVEFFSTSEQACQMQALLSLTSNQDENVSLRLKIDNADFEHLNLLQTWTGFSGRCIEGMASMEASFLFEEGILSKASLENCNLEKMRLYFPEQEVTVCSDRIVGDCLLENGKVSDFHVNLEGGNYFNSHLHLTGLSSCISYEQGSLQPSEIKGRLGDLSAEISFLGSHEDHLADVKISGNAKDLLSHFTSGKENLQENLQMQLDAALKMESGTVSLEGNIFLSDEKINGSALFSTKVSSLADLLLGNQPDIVLKEGKLQAERLTEKSYGALIPQLFPNIQMTGILQCEALFSPSRIQVQVSGEKLHLSHPLAILTLPGLQERPAQFFYDFQSGLYQGELPLNDAEFKYLDCDLSFQNIEGSLKLENDCIKASSLYAECEGIGLRGNAELSFGFLKEPRLTVSTSQIAGDVSCLLSLFNKFPTTAELTFPISGNFSSGERGFVLSVPLTSNQGVAEWSFKGSFDGLSFPVNAATSITDGHCDVIFDSISRQCLIQNGQGNWKLIDGSLFQVQLKKFSTGWDGNTPFEFALQVVDGKKEFVHLDGKAARQGDSEWNLVFEPQRTHVGGVGLQITRCILNGKKHISSFEMKPILKCQNLQAEIAFLQNAGFISPLFSTHLLKEWQLEGTLKTHLFSDDLKNGFSLHVESPDLKVKGEAWSPLQLNLKKMGEKWAIEKCQSGPIALKGIFHVDAEGLTFPQFESAYGTLLMKGSGYLKTNAKRFACTLESVKGVLQDLSFLPSLKSPFAPKGTFIAGVALLGDFSDPNIPMNIKGEANFFFDVHSPIPIAAHNLRPVKFSYSSLKGLSCDEIYFHLKHKMTGAALADVSALSLNLQPAADLVFKQGNFSLTPAFIGYGIDAKWIPDSFKSLQWEGNLEGSGDLQLCSKNAIFHGTLKPGRYGYENKNLNFEQIHLDYDQDILSLRAKARIENQLLWASLQVNLSEEPYGILKLFDHPKAEGLKFLFRSQSGKYLLQSVQGSCYGLDCSLAKNPKVTLPHATVLSGEIKMDGNSLCALLPKELREGLEHLKWGSGYEWQGDLTLFHQSAKGYSASGVLSGQDFEVLGYTFSNLEGTLEANPERIVFSNIKIEDPAGNVSIKSIVLK